jgi:alkylation response protein AidB-like acyl-CoA dehydrogenase
VLSTTNPTRADFVRRATDAAEVLRANAQWTTENRRLPEKALDVMAEAGVFKMRVPARFGGYESDAVTMLEVTTEIAKGDGSAAWNLSVWTVSAWIAAQFPDHVQEEAFASDARFCGVLSPTATATPTAGGYTVSGRWHFISGALHSQYQVALAMGPAPDGTQWPLVALIPMTDLKIDDDWHTVGLRGTGSVSTIADDVFVPEDRVLPLVLVLQGQSASALNAQRPAFKVPMMPTGCLAFTGTAIGLAKSAMELFLANLDRKITYTDYTSQRAAPVTHLQVAEAAMKIEEAESHALRLAELADRKAAAGEEWALQERVISRAYLGRIFRLSKEAADTLGDASGGTSVYSATPIRRVIQDLQVLNQHAAMNPATTAELYGRILCGLPPNTMYL